jgi:diacylglycerol O-acyltransferase / wax synthase
MSTVERLSGADRAWLLMDRPTNLMVVIGLIILQAPLERARLRALVEERFLRFKRFRCVPVADTWGARWLETPQFDIDDHISCAALPAPAGQPELEALLGELAGTPFNPGRPLWSFHLVERYRGGSAIIVRIHHSYADGIALVQVLLALAAAGPLAAAPVPSEPVQSSVFPIGIVDLVPAPISAALQLGTDLVGSGIDYLLHPTQASAAALSALAATGELAHIAAMTDDPATRLKRPLSGARRAAWADPLPLEEVRTVAHVLGCTVNDVLVSSLAGALGHYLAAHGDEVTDLTIRAVVPVNLRTDSEPPSLGNRFGLVFMHLPIGIAHPLERLDAVHTAMQKLKGSSQAAATLGLLSVIGSLPAQVEDPMITLFSAKASLVFSNLPGPREPLQLCGVVIRQVLFWVPEAGSIGTGVSMLSYRGEVHFGVISDRQMIERPHELLALIGAEFERLVCLVLLGSTIAAE